jgi:hypothetical protein
MLPDFKYATHRINLLFIPGGKFRIAKIAEVGVVAKQKPPARRRTAFPG